MDKTDRFSFLGLLLALAFAAGCSESPVDNGFYFAGHVRDGVTGEPILLYELELLWLDRSKDGDVDDEGRYFVGPLSEFHDYTVRIRAPGYRPFTSHNAMRPTGPPDGVQSFIFDAYMFPTDLRSPETQVDVFFDDQEGRPTGSVRLRPVSSSILFDEPDETPASVGAQLWANDEDLLNATVLVDLEDGQAKIDEGVLVYGVTYDVTVLGVPGYQVADGGQFTAGIDRFATATLSQFRLPPLELTFNSVDLGPVAQDGAQVTLIFNQDIDLDPTETSTTWAEIVDNSVSIVTSDEDGDGTTNTLHMSMSASEQERGAAIQVEGNRIELSWSEQGLAMRDADDRIRAVVFGGLDNVGIRPLAGGTATFTTLGAFTGPSLTLPLLP